MLASLAMVGKLVMTRLLSFSLFRWVVHDHIDPLVGPVCMGTIELYIFYKTKVLYHQQEGEIERCKSCALVFHKSCFGKLIACPCGAQLRPEEVAALTKKASSRGRGEAVGAVDLLGRKLSSGLGGGFLTGLFSRARPEKALDRKDSDNVILMGSLPSTSL